MAPCYNSDAYAGTLQPLNTTHNSINNGNDYDNTT